MSLLIIFAAVFGSILLGFNQGSRLDGSMIRLIARRLRARWIRVFDRLVKKQITVSLTGDDAGFRYTVRYSRLRLLPRVMLPYETGEIEFDTDDLPADLEEDD